MSIIEQQILTSIAKAAHKAYGLALPPEARLDTPPDEQLGDFAFACFPLARLAKSAPAAIAARLAQELTVEPPIARVQAVGPYLNFTVEKEALFRVTCTEILAAPETFGNCDEGKGEKVLIEYSAPNTNKPQHLGHVRNNLLGMAISNLLEAIGHQVVRVNLVNDRGVHICKSMLAYQEFGQGKTPQSEGIKGDHFVGDFYVLYEKQQHQEWQQWLAARGIDPKGLDDQERRRLEAEFLSQSRWYGRVKEMLQRWEAGDAEVLALWRRMNDWVYEGFDQTYRRLGCKFDKVYKESETYQLGRALVEEGLERGLFYRKPDGSVWVDLSDEGLGEKLLLRSDGTSVYITQDIGTTKLKFDDFGMKRAIWVVGDEQIYHFQVLFAIMKKLGFPWAEGCYHLAYGMIDLPAGKMKSREGTVVDADDLMDELFRMEREEIARRHLDIAPEDLDSTAEILAQGALKFYILKFGPQSRMLFDPAESISFDGFTGPYVQYAYVRVRSIFRKSGKDEFAAVSPEECDFSVLVEPEEIALVRRLHSFPGEVKAAALTYNPARLATYLWELAKAFSRFYHEHSVLHAQEERLRQARLVLAKATSIVLRRGLALLGIDVPERM
ncbi:MAG: arginine--tRNA ligase [candidate division KSB1 bacterium]|nr:arginine--tRNA ligase [candidate division KSB1 bacterium]MDZ7385599.1 arginine--tRNA ligase [candidate division KSB1 bacterium]MDZ7394186.1 arginine--tRNA ligase [candidate division KSB1 bacterium]MDZ7414162.1 arginine--tRNA ligase [candidate division KSB1 bacterium]